MPVSTPSESPALAALVVDPDGDFRYEHLPAASDQALLDALYRVIGCVTVDCVRLADDLDMWLDDEALVTDPPAAVNSPATLVAFGHGLLHQRVYYGTAVFFGGHDEAGVPVALGGAAAERVRAVLERVGPATA